MQLRLSHQDIIYRKLRKEKKLNIIDLAEAYEKVTRKTSLKAD